MSNTYNYHHPSPISQTHHTNKRGFTIVELLIVIVVIAILAAISVVAYNGIQNRAYDTTVQSDLRQTYTKIQEYNITNDQRLDVVNDPTYPTYSAQIAALNSVFVTTRSAYNTLILCSNSEDVAIIARSQSGNGFYYSSVSGAGTISTWPGNYNANLCPVAGIPTTSTNYRFSWIKNDTWRGWFTVGR
ncbi:MAG: type II secretion system protein [Candidatus Saccharimonas sp.]